MNILPEDMIFHYLDSNGDGTGTTNAIGDYSTPDQFYFEALKNCSIHRILISVGDATGSTAQEYGGLSALTNGVELKVYDQTDTEILDLTAGNPIKSNAEWGKACYDVDLKTWGAGNEILVIRWTFDKAGTPINLAKGQKISIDLSDNFTGLLSHNFFIQGYYG